MPVTSVSSLFSPILKVSGRIDDADIRTCARVIFDHFGTVADLYTLKKLKEAEAEGNMAAVAVWARIAGVISTFEGMQSTAVH